MAEIVLNEQNIKSTSAFLKLKDKSKLKIKSHLIRLFVSFWPEQKKTILWTEKVAEKKKQEFYYYAEVDGEEGVLRLPASLFFMLNETERILGKDKRSFEWLISKSGEGLNTKYSAIRGEEIEISENEIEENTKKLKKIVESYEMKLAENLREYLASKGEI